MTDLPTPHLASFILASNPDPTDWQLHARGGMADVFRTADAERPLAIKVLRNTDDADQRERFAQEGMVGRQLAAVSGLTVPFHSFESSLGPAHVMPWRSECLADRLAQRSYEPCGILAMLTELLPALTALHEAGVAHNDIKPENVLIDSQGYHSLCDLGSARKLSAEPPGHFHHPLLLGTPQYQAPELFNGSSPSVASDIYGVGCLTFHAICGVPPLIEEDIMVLASSVGDPLPPLAAFRKGFDGFEALVARALSADPDSRFSSAPEMNRAAHRVSL